MSLFLRIGRTTAALAASIFSAEAVLAQESPVILLPAPTTAGGAPLTRALAERRSVRTFQDAPLTLAEVAQLLWAAQGVTQESPKPAGWPSAWGEWGGGRRTAPSAGALYPLETYLLAVAVEGLEAGVYRYLPGAHALERTGACGSGELAGAALGQTAITQASAVVVFTAVYARAASKYADRAERYVHIEVGAAAENLLLQATALGLGGVFMGAFRDDAVSDVLGVPEDHAPLGIVPVGKPGG